MKNLVTLGLENFVDPSNGKPVSGGSIFIGVADADPETSPKDIFIRQEDGNIIPAAQPIQIGGGGVPLYNGSPAQILVDGDYSIKVKNYLGAQVYYVPNSMVVGPISPINTVADLRNITPTQDRAVQLLGYYSPGDGGGGPLRVGKTGAAPGTYVDNGGSIIVPTGGDGSAAWVWEWSGAVNVKWCGAIGNSLSNDTLAIQSAINSHDSLYFPQGFYLVDFIEFAKTNATYFFDNAYLRAASNYIQDAVVVLKNIRHNTFYDLRVDQNFKENYKSAVQWKSVDVGVLPPSQYNTINGLRIFNATIGLLYGDTEDLQPERNVHSENILNDFIARGVEIPIYFNQPNGFLFMSNPVIDSTRMEWTGRPGFEADSRCIKMIYGNLKIQGGQITKTQTNQGFAVESYGQLSLNGTTIESACDIFSLGNKPDLVNWSQQQDLMIGDVASLITTADRKTFEFQPSTSGRLSLSNSLFRRPAASAVSVVPLIAHNDSTEWVVKISNTLFPNYRAINYISNGTGGPQNTHSIILLMSSSRLGSDVYGWVTLDSGIVERGSNSNGEYILTGDGTLYCWKKNHQITVDITTASGPGFRNSVGNVACRWTPPRSFSSTTSVVFNGSTSTGDDVFVKGALVSAINDIRVQLWSGTSRASYAVSVDLFAIGRAAQ